MTTYHMNIMVSVEAESPEEAMGKLPQHCSEHDRKIVLTEKPAPKPKAKVGKGSY